MKKTSLKVSISLLIVLVIMTFEVKSEQIYANNTSIALANDLVNYTPNIKLETTKVLNKGNVTNNNEKRVILEAAHGLGYGPGDCNHASGTSGGVTYYENKEARIMIEKIAGYLNSAGIKYEISNQIAGDSFFNGTYQEGCDPEAAECCGFHQGTVGPGYSPLVYQHIDEVGPSKYIFAFELHFNAGGGNYSTVMCMNPDSEPCLTNGKRITDAVDKVIGTTGSHNSEPYFDGGKLLGTVNSMENTRGIKTYYLETLFMDSQQNLDAYAKEGNKDKLAKEIAQALVIIAGSNNRVSETIGDSENTEELTGGSLVDFNQSYPNLLTSDDFDCKAIFMDRATKELNDLGQTVKTLFNLIKIGSPVITIILITLDYLKAMSSNDPANNQKKANKRSIKRAVIGLSIFALPYLLDLVFRLYGLYDLSRCYIG